MECKDLKKLNLKGYFVTEGSLKPINHKEIINQIDINNHAVVVRLRDVINRLK